MIHMCRKCCRVRIQPGMRMLRRNKDGSIVGEETWAKLMSFGGGGVVSKEDVSRWVETLQWMAYPIAMGLCPQCEKKAIAKLAKEQHA